MRVHHLNCGCMCPLGGALMTPEHDGVRGRLVCHCLLIETKGGLVLVDTGFGSEDVRHTYPRLSHFFVVNNGVVRSEACTALAEVRRVGFRPEDVRHIILTHLDFDHAGGLSDFPNATVHLTAAEVQAAERRSGFIGRRRYRPMQWANRERWRRYTPQGDRWFGFEAVRQLEGLPPEILLIPLRGHTLGHAGVAVDTGSGWLLNAGDAYFYRDEVGRPVSRFSPGLQAYQCRLEQDRPARIRNQARVRELSLRHSDEVTVFCSHDLAEYRSLAASGAGSAVQPERSSTT